MPAVRAQRVRFELVVDVPASVDWPPAVVALAGGMADVDGQAPDVVELVEAAVSMRLARLGCRSRTVAIGVEAGAS